VTTLMIGSPLWPPKGSNDAPRWVRVRHPPGVIGRRAEPGPRTTPAV
jgi:hypothetical protein